MKTFKFKSFHVVHFSPLQLKMGLSIFGAILNQMSQNGPDFQVEDVEPSRKKALIFLLLQNYKYTRLLKKIIFSLLVFSITEGNY